MIHTINHFAINYSAISNVARGDLDSLTFPIYDFQSRIKFATKWLQIGNGIGATFTDKEVI